MSSNRVNRTGYEQQRQSVLPFVPTSDAIAVDAIDAVNIAGALFRNKWIKGKIRQSEHPQPQPQPHPHPQLRHAAYYTTATRWQMDADWDAATTSRLMNAKEKRSEQQN